MAVNINVPSQVKTYANLAAFPATGALKTIYIAEDTNKTYRWTGSVYTEISASAAMMWGAIGGTLSNQTDLQSALDAKVPTSRTLTINGVTQDLSANRTFTISTGITIGTTAITSGTVGRVLFQGTGNVVQQSSSLFWDDTNAYLNLGATGTFNTARIIFNQPRLSAINGIVWADNVAFPHGFIALDRSSGEFRWSPNSGGYFPTIYSNGSEAMRIATTRNVLIGTTTDAGFRLDVNGTARVQGNAQFGTGFYWNNSTNRLGIGTSSPLWGLHYNVDGGLNVGMFSSYGTTSTFESLLYLFRSRGTSSAPSAVLSGDNLGSLRFAGQWGSSLNEYTTGAKIEGVATQNFSSSVNSARMSFYTTADGSNAIRENMRLFSSGNLLLQNGGTFTDAGFRLDVNGTARVKATSTTGEIFTTQTSTGLEALVVYADRSLYIYGSNVSGYTTNIRIGGQANMANINFFGNNNIYVGQGGSTENIPSALIAMGSTNKGFLPPRMTTTQKNAIASPAAGLMVYDTTLNVISYYNGTMWI